MPSPWLAVGCSAIGGIIFSAGGAPMSAALQVITPNEMRGRISALYLFIVNVLGTGLGPTFIATLTQYVFHAEAKLYLSLAVSAAIAAPVPVICYWYVRRHYGDAFVRARSWA
jgi:MFS family permease